MFFRLHQYFKCVRCRQKHLIFTIFGFELLVGYNLLILFFHILQIIITLTTFNIKILNLINKCAVANSNLRSIFLYKIKFIFNIYFLI